MSEPSLRERSLFLRYPYRFVALVLFLGAFWFGWWEFWWRNDDAYITFRYISNSMKGWGWTWNPPPFRRVEGYSNFLWLLLLEGTWRATGIEPPEASDAWAFLSSLGICVVIALTAWGFTLPQKLERYRFAGVCLVLAATISNRTFLVWASSGLETALFGLLVSAWCYVLIRRDRGLQPSMAFASMLAALSALTRPDGILLVAATLALICVDAIRDRQWKRSLTAAVPLLLPLAHLLWRHAYYGYWVPNTYVAKHVAPWPEAGLRYLHSFVLEYALWSWPVIAAVALFLGRRRLRAWHPMAHLGKLTATAVLIAHAAYYVLRIGGDHFEYRIFAHAMPWLFALLLWMLVRATQNPVAILGCFVGAVGAGLPIPWIHHFESGQFAESVEMNEHFRTVFPSALHFYSEPYYRSQEWLLKRRIALRQEHLGPFAAHQRVFTAPRSEGEQLDVASYPVTAAGAVGVRGWHMSNAVVIDLFGLNDLVIARNPAPSDPELRSMAHDRSAPKGYVECFMPNLQPYGGKLVLVERKVPLTPETIRACEAEFASKQ